MALSITLLDSTVYTTNDNTITSGSISPTGDALIIVSVMGLSSADGEEPSSASDTLTGTGSYTRQNLASGTADDYVDTAIFTAQLGSSPGTGTVTVTYSNSLARKIMHVYEVTGFDTATPVQQFQVNTGSSTTLTVTLDSSPASDSMVVGAVGGRTNQLNEDFTPGTGFTELSEDEYNDIYASGGITLQTQYDITSADTTCDWSGLYSGGNDAGVAVEINAESAAEDLNVSVTAASHTRTGIKVY